MADNEIEVYRRELRIPPDEELYEFHLPDPFLGDRWKGFSVWRLGILLPPQGDSLSGDAGSPSSQPKKLLGSRKDTSRAFVEHEPRNYPWPHIIVGSVSHDADWLSMFAGPGTDSTARARVSASDPSLLHFVVQLRLQHAYYEDNPVYAQVVWHPESPRRESIQGLEASSNRGHDASIAVRGFALLDQKIPQGRRHGTSIFETRQECEDAILAVVEDLRRKGLAVTQTAVALALDCDPRTLINQLDYFGLSWKGLKRGIKA